MTTMASPSATARSRVQLRSSRRKGGSDTCSGEFGVPGLGASCMLTIVLYNMLLDARQRLGGCRDSLERKILFLEGVAKNGHGGEDSCFGSQNVFAERRFGKSSGVSSSHFFVRPAILWADGKCCRRRAQTSITGNPREDIAH